MSITILIQLYLKKSFSKMTKKKSKLLNLNLRDTYLANKLAKEHMQ